MGKSCRMEELVLQVGVEGFGSVSIEKHHGNRAVDVHVDPR